MASRVRLTKWQLQACILNDLCLKTVEGSVANERRFHALWSCEHVRLLEQEAACRQDQPRTVASSEDRAFVNAQASVEGMKQRCLV